MLNLLKTEYHTACITKSDINEHLPILYELAKTCRSVTEFGVRDGQSTRAFLYAQVKLRSYDLEKDSKVQLLFDRVKENQLDVEYLQANILTCIIEPTDFLFIDTLHTYNQLKSELSLHAKQVNRFIAIHDTVTFGSISQDGSIPGLTKAIEEFLVNNPSWKLKMNYVNNNGLTILEKDDKLLKLPSYLQNPEDSKSNFDLAQEYEQLGQTASAASFYLRAAERSLNPLIQYIALIRNALCFKQQGDRFLTIKTLLQRAITILPNRPEGYFFLSQLFEERKEYHEAYLMACIGLENQPTSTDGSLPEYPGKLGLLFQKAVNGWWVGLNEESREILFDLQFNYTLSEPYGHLVELNLKNIGFPKHKFVYKKSYINYLNYPFPNIEQINYNYSQIFQDLFVLTVLDGKKQGTYLEIGSNDPFYNNNTALLETQFDWEGISIDLDESCVTKFKEQRKNPCLCQNALEIDYKELLEEWWKTKPGIPKEIDYLQVDCDPPEISFQVLQKVIESGFIFKVITFEHDYYYNQKIRELSRNYLRDQGYSLRIGNVSFNKSNPFEDWWVKDNKVKGCFTMINNDKINYIPEIFYSI